MASGVLKASAVAWCLFSAMAVAGKDPLEPPSVIVGNTRVQALSSILFRVEPKGKYGWESRNTFMVQNRKWEGLHMRKEETNNGDTKIITDHYTIILIQGGAFLVFDKETNGTELYRSDTDKNWKKNLLHWPSPGAASSYAIVDSPRFHVPDWGAAPCCPEGVTVPDYEASTNGYGYSNDVDGDTYVFLLGKGMDGWNAARAEFGRLTGPVPVLPDWAFGTWFTVWMGYWEAWAKSEVKRWANDKVPLDIWGLDVNWRISDQWYMEQSYDYPNTKAFPDYSEWFSWLKKQGVRTYFNDHPFQKGPQTSAEEISYRWNGLTKWLGKGLSFWWFDHNWKFSIGPPMAAAAGNHPTYWKGLSTTAWGSHVYWTVIDNFNRYHRPTDLFAGGRAVTLSMSNPINEISGFHAESHKLAPDSWALPVDPARVAESPGHHRYPVWWNGDFATMNNNLEMMVDAGVHDFKPYVHPDCGGDVWYAQWWKDQIPASLIRQAAMCSFGTILRFHGGDHQPWKYGDVVENAIRRYITFRYKFMPMLIAAGYRANRDGFPFVARVDLYWPDYGKFSLNHQYIFLDDILVAPIFGTVNMSKADVWIPPGRWQNVWNGDIVTGPKDISEWQPTERQPMWMRMDGGLLVMTDKPGLQVDKGDWSELTLDAYPCIGACNTTRIIYERSLEIDPEPSNTTISLLTNGRGVVTVHIGENTARLERAWTIRVNMNPGEEVVEATVDGEAVDVKTIQAHPSDDGTPFRGFWPFGGKDANPASKAGHVAQVSLEKSARARTLLLKTGRPIANCAWSGEGCLVSKCCKVFGDKCYAKNDSWAACKPGCTAGAHTDADGDSEPWSCNVLGIRPRVVPVKPIDGVNKTLITGALKTLAVRPTAKPIVSASKNLQKPAPAMVFHASAADSATRTIGTSLFCFTVQTPEVKWQEEVLNIQRYRGAGIFACNATKVYYTLCLGCHENAFLETWGEIQDGGQFKEHDWIVKVDIGAVFLPSVLVQHLSQLSSLILKVDSALYIQDSRHDMVNSLMVFSREAVETYFKDENRKSCEKHFGNHSEEHFFADCFDTLGIGQMVAHELVKVSDSQQPAATECSPGRHQRTFAAFSPNWGASRSSHKWEWEPCYMMAAGIPRSGMTRSSRMDWREPMQGVLPPATALPMLGIGALAAAIALTIALRAMCCSCGEFGSRVAKVKPADERRMNPVPTGEGKYSSVTMLIPPPGTEESRGG
jgi:hypothetical protein